MSKEEEEVDAAKEKRNHGGTSAGKSYIQIILRYDTPFIEMEYNVETCAMAADHTCVWRARGPESRCTPYLMVDGGEWDRKTVVKHPARIKTYYS